MKKAQMWDKRYSDPDYLYGTAPNDFLREHAQRIPAKGRVLCLAEGEGRNAVYLASLGYDVTGVDSSAVGLEKAQRLAKARGQTITTIVTDLAQFSIKPESWDGIVSIFCHLPPAMRAQVYQRAVAGLRPGGVFLLEAYTPRQIALKTGGPDDPARMPDLPSLRTELEGLRIDHGIELERDVIEGAGHFGRGAVVQVLAVKPSSGGPQPRTPA
jgi:SAM-dependent methyltransferase